MQSEPSSQPVPVTVRTGAAPSQGDKPWRRQVLAPGIHKGTLRQSHHVVGGEGDAVDTLQLDLTGEGQRLAGVMATGKGVAGLPGSAFPYGQNEGQWCAYALAPHSYADLGNGECQVGLNFHHRFLHLDLGRQSACLLDPGVNDEFLSSTNHADRRTGELWFASWPLDHTLRRIVEPDAGATVSLWKMPRTEAPQRIWQGEAGDALHQVALCPNRRFVVITELGLRSRNGQPIGQISGTGCGRKVPGLIPSQVVVLDLRAGGEWRLGTITAGHVEFDPVDPEIFYLSSHNIGLVGLQVGIFGPGAILKFRLDMTGPSLVGSFSRADFHRITTHVVFKHRGETLIGVTGYPGSIFLIDGTTMQLARVINLGGDDPVSLRNGPHFCRLDSYGITPSDDGETLLVGTSDAFHLFEVATGEKAGSQPVQSVAPSSFTGHLGACLCPELPGA